MTGDRVISGVTSQGSNAPDRPAPDPWATVALALGRAPEEPATDGPPDHPSGQAAPAGWARAVAGLRAPVPLNAGAPTVETGVATVPAPAPAADVGPAADAGRRRLGPTRPTRLGLTMRGRIVAVVAVIVVVIAGVGGGVLATRGRGLPANVVLSVDGQQVTKAEFQTNNTVLKSFYGLNPPAASDQKAYTSYRQTAAKAYAIDLLLDRAAAQMKLTVPPQQVTNEMNQLIKTATGGDQAKLNQALTASGLTQQDLRTQIRRQLEETELYNRIGGKVDVTAAQVTQTFNANTAALALPATRAISHIVVADQNTAQSIITQLAQGGDFATLAAQDSLDTNSKANGGALGTLAQSQLATAFGQAAFSAQLNVPFGPIDEGSGSGWDVGLVTAINPGQAAVDNAATQAIIRTYVTDEVQSRRWTTWLSGQLAHAHITYASGYQPAQAHAAPETPVPSLASLVLEQLSGGTSTTASQP